MSRVILIPVLLLILSCRTPTVLDEAMNPSKALQEADVVVLGVPKRTRFIKGPGLAFRAMQTIGIESSTVVELEVTLDTFCVLDNRAQPSAEGEEVSYRYEFVMTGNVPPGDSRPFGATAYPSLFFLTSRRGSLRTYAGERDSFLEIPWARKEAKSCGKDRRRFVERLALTPEFDVSGNAQEGLLSSFEARVGMAQRLLGFSRTLVFLTSSLDAASGGEWAKTVCSAIAYHYPVSVPSNCKRHEPYAGSDKYRQRAAIQIGLLQQKRTRSIASIVGSDDVEEHREYLRLLSRSDDPNVRDLSQRLLNELASPRQ